MVRIVLDLDQHSTPPTAGKHVTITLLVRKQFLLVHKLIVRLLAVLALVLFAVDLVELLQYVLGNAVLLLAHFRTVGSI
jgi:hypothetical protein